MTIRYYGQYGDDNLLWQFFGYKSKGFYVDVGAFDGVLLSNTYSFEQQGWTGICVEALPQYYELCKKARPGSICLHGACVGDDLVSVKFNAERLGLLSGIAPQAADVQARYENRGMNFGGFQAIDVPAFTLNSILQEHVNSDIPIDFISIDVEGSELDVLRGLDLHLYRPRVLIVEANRQEMRLAITNYLIGHGYKLARKLHVNMYFVRTRLDVLRLRMIDVDCVVEAPPHPLGEEYTRQKSPKSVKHLSIQKQSLINLWIQFRKQLTRTIRFIL